MEVCLWTGSTRSAPSSCGGTLCRRCANERRCGWTLLAHLSPVGPRTHKRCGFALPVLTVSPHLFGMVGTVYPHLCQHGTVGTVPSRLSRADASPSPPRRCVGSVFCGDCVTPRPFAVGLLVTRGDCVLTPNRCRGVPVPTPLSPVGTASPHACANRGDHAPTHVP